jgi:hypothetical protein
MSEKALRYEEFVRLVIDAIEAAGIEYLIGGAVATWAWENPDQPSIGYGRQYPD